MKNIKKRLAALCMAVVVSASALPMQVFAAEATDNLQNVTEVETEATETTEQQPEGEENSTEIQPVELESETTEISEPESDTEELNETNLLDIGEENEEEEETEINEVQEGTMNYLTVDSSFIQAPATQNIVVSVEGDTAQIASAVLKYKNLTTGVEETASATGISQGAVLFSISYVNENETAVYQLSGIEYVMDKVTYYVDFQQNGIDARYGVNQEVDTNPDALMTNEDEETSSENLEDAISVVSVDENGNMITEESVSQALESAGADVGQTLKMDSFDEQSRSGKNVVVVLDPGHGGSDPGTSGFGLNEKDINLKIALYCRAELEKYYGVTVYMTRTTDNYVGLDERTTMAQNWGADVIVSIHANYSSNTSVSGVEIYYPNNNYNSSIGSQGSALASKIINQLAALGLNNRGTKIRDAADYTYPDGSRADYYSIIRNAKLKGFPGIIIEHAFLSNGNDVNNFLTSDAKLQQLGIADATGIAEYFGLSKQGALTIRSITPTANKDDVTIDVGYTTAAGSVQFRYLYYDVNAGTWGVISEWTHASTISWKPAPGTYWIQVAAIDSNNIGTVGTVGFSNTRDYTQKYVELSGICYQFHEHTIDVGVGYETNDDNAVKFRWQAYNLETGKWETIADWNSGNWATWTPKKGNYWLQVQAKTSTGMTADCTICFAADRNYTTDYVDLTGICYQFHEHSIDVGAAYDTGDSGTTFRWLAYNLDTGEWETIADWNSGNWATWTPKKGNYWLQVQAKTSTGITADFTICFAADRNYTTDYVELNGICYQFHDHSIDVGAAYNTGDSGTTFRWQAYNLDTGEWETIADWNGGNWATWTPKKGNYWLQVQARTSTGLTADYTICFSVDRNYTLDYIDIAGVCIVKNTSTVDLGVAYDSGDPNVIFKWQVYNLATCSWTTIADWAETNWTTWKPESGNYWIYVTGQTSKGTTASFCQPVSLNMGYEIMGSSETTLLQMVNYYNSKATYPFYYVTSDAPTIIEFCQIYIDECTAEGVRPEVAFCQAMKETGFLTFKGDVSIAQYNFAGLGAVGNGAAGDSFPTVREGIRAQVQHLKAYASTAPLVNACVDKRFGYVTRGCSPYVEWLGINENPYGKGWATAKNYGYSIVNDYISKLMTF